MQRIDLVPYRQTAITPDTVEALRQLELRAAELGNVRIHYGGPSPRASWKFDLGPTGAPAPMSLFLAGREVHLRLEFAGQRVTRWEEVAALWGLAVPLGFTPWNRYPVAGACDEVFHYLGPWQALYDHVCSEGRGEVALPSVACAAQVDVGRWEGPRPLERFVQAQLHRLGAPCGPVDGEVGPRTQQALQAVGMKGIALTEAANALAGQQPAETPAEQRRKGHLIMPVQNLSISTYGRISSIRTTTGAALTIDGPGRIVVDVTPQET